MKKLMIAAAVALVAVASQASAFQWTTSNKVYLDGNEVNTWKDGDVLTALTSGTKGYMDSASYNIISWSADIALTYEGSTENINDVEVVFGSHKINKPGIQSNLFELPTDDSGKTYEWTVVITGSWLDADGKEWTITSNEITGSKEYSKMTNPQINTAAPSTWTVTGPSDVPEPTSGLLLLLGVAGLALRRKQK